MSLDAQVRTGTVNSRTPPDIHHRRTQQSVGHRSRRGINPFTRHYGIVGKPEICSRETDRTSELSAMLHNSGD